MKQELSKELYQRTFDKLHAPEELFNKVDNLDYDMVKQNKKTVMRRAILAAAVVAALFILSNAVALAATGHPWIGKIFDWNAEPSRPRDNIADFFIENGSLFDSSSPERDYYGGTYLENGTQVILLTDMSRNGDFIKPCENLRFEKCEYTLDEMTRGMSEINGKLAALRAQGERYAADIVGLSIDEKENRMRVGIYHKNAEKEEWFRKNISDVGYLVLEDVKELPGED